MQAYTVTASVCYQPAHPPLDAKELTL